MSIPLTLKVKNGKTTVFVLVEKSGTVSDVLKQVVQRLNDSSSASGEEVGDDLEIPVPSFETDSISEAPEHSAGKNSKTIVTEDSIRLAIPISKTDLSKGWKDITDDTSSFEDLGIKDLSTLAYTDSPEGLFEVEIATEDNE